MRTAIAGMLGCGGVLLGASSAGAETYRILDGRLEHADSGVSEVLEGVLEISLFEIGGRLSPPSLRVDDFQLRAGDLDFGPRQPVEFQDYPVLFLQIADQIQFDADSVGFWYLRSGGELVAADDQEVTFRFADLRGDGPNAGELVGQLGDGLLPRRLTLVGTLYEVDQHFRIPTGDCPVIPLPPRDGGGVIINGGGVVFESTSAPTPTLAELGITAPSGAEVRSVDPLPPIDPLPFCSSLLATFPPDERELARITLVATAARPIGIEVEPRHRGRPGHARHGVIEVAILGSEEFDIRDVEVRSLRLGPAEAEPTRHRGLGRTRRVDVNRDGETDLLVRFDAHEAEIPGDGVVCLWGETRDGSLIEGCDSAAVGLERERRGRPGRQDEDD